MVSSRWAKVQCRYHDRIGSRKCETKWTATLTAKIIDIVADLWKHRNEALHKRDNVVRQKDHDKLNNEIQNYMRQLPRSLRVFTPAEQKIFRRRKITQLTKCNIRQKQQWITTAQSIINGFRENLHTNPQARTMWRAMNLIQTEQTQIQHNQHENDDQGNQNIEDDQTNDNERNKRNNNNTGDNNTDDNDDNDDTDNKSTNSNENRMNTEAHDIKNKDDKNDENDPNG